MKKNGSKEEPKGYYPQAEVTRINRLPTPPARLPADIVRRAYAIMKKNNWTPTMFIEKAWTLLVEKEDPPREEEK